MYLIQLKEGEFHSYLLLTNGNPTSIWHVNITFSFMLYVHLNLVSSTPVGVDFYRVGERGEQFGPYGALYPAQVHNQTGRGYFRCSDISGSESGNSTASDRG